MSFLYPGFLWALFALSIPVIIHLFNFRRTRQVYFSTTRYLRQVKEITTSKRRLKQLLILLARLLFLLFLVLAFAQPFIPAEKQMAAQQNVAIYIDNSMSMSAQMNEQERAMDDAIMRAQEIINTLPEETRYRIITNDFAPFSNTYKTKPVALDLLTQVRMSPISREAEEVVRYVNRGERDSEGLEVFWFSDFQRSTFGTQLELDTTTRWQFSPVSPVNSDNVYFDSVYLENPFAVGSEQNALRVVLHNDGKKDRETINLRLSINGTQAAATAVNLPAGSKVIAELDITDPLMGLNEAQLTINDFPVSFDNEFYLTMNATERIRVLEISRSSSPTAVGLVYGNRQVFDFRSYNADNFNYSLLSSSDLVVLNELDAISSGLSIALNEFSRDGGSILVIPAANPDLESYAALLHLPLSKVDVPEREALDAPDFNNPFFQNVFEERTTALVMPSAQRTIDWGPDRSAILSLRSGKPFLSLLGGNGKQYVMSAPLDKAYSDLATNALFVPVMYKIAAGAQRKINRPYYLLSEQFIVQKVDSLQDESPLRLIGENEVIPSQRRVAGLIYMDLPKFALTNGFYRLVHQSDTLDLMAFDLDKRESRMGRLTRDELANLLGSGQHISILETDSAEAFSSEIKARYLGRPLWKYALALALVFLLAEILLIRFMK